LGRPLRDAAGFGVFLILGKLPEVQGAMKYWYVRAFHRRSGIIEYR